MRGSREWPNLDPDTRYFTPSPGDASDTIYAFQVNASSLPTGEYPYTVVFTAMIGSTYFTRTYQGDTTGNQRG
jgi:hypothetical protein